MAPERQSFAAARVVKASRRLAGAKWVWLEDYGLWNGPEGSYLGATKLAQRIGFEPDTVEKYRKTLRKLGLLTGIPRPGGRGGNDWSWFATIPDEFVPSSRQPLPEDIERLRRALDRYIDARLAGDTNPPVAYLDGRQASPGPAPQRRHDSIPRCGGPVSPGLSIEAVEVVGGVYPLASQKNASSSPSSDAGAQRQDGGVAHATEQPRLNRMIPVADLHLLRRFTIP